MSQSLPTGRIASLIDLLELRRPLSDAIEGLRAWHWDSLDELVEVRPIHVEAAMTRFESGRLSAAELEEWAEAVHGRDDIADNSPHNQLSEILFELASPELFDELEVAVPRLLVQVRAIEPG